MNNLSFTRDLGFYATKKSAKLWNQHSGLVVEWFDDWHPILNEALQNLPEVDDYPHELFRLLFLIQDPKRRRIALLTENKVPVAVMGLRQGGSYSWEMITQWTLPGFVFPVKEGYLETALIALGIDLRVAWWRMKSSVPIHPLIRDIKKTPTYRMKCSEDFEQYWRESNHFKSVRQARNRCSEFTFDVDLPGMAEWVIRNWIDQWWGNFDPEMQEFKDKLLVANYLMAIKKYHTLVIRDNETPIAGATLSVHGNDLVAGVIYRKPEYGRYGVGNRLIDLTFQWAAQTGYETFDIGGGQEYKRRWAPQEGERLEFNVCPEYLYQVKRFVNWGREIRYRILNRNQKENTI
jgi:hypothetical protein